MNIQNLNLEINQKVNYIDKLIKDPLCRKAAKVLVQLVVEREHHLNWDECVFAIENEIATIGSSKAYGELTTSIIMSEVNQFNRDFMKEKRYLIKINKG